MREKITVLIADDNQEFSMTLATYLKNQEDMVVVGTNVGAYSLIATTFLWRTQLVICYNNMLNYVLLGGKHD